MTGGGTTWLEQPGPRVAGVAERLAHRMGAHVGVVRLAFATTALAGGAGAVLYAVAAIVLRGHSFPSTRPATTRHDLGCIAAAAAVTAAMGTWFPWLPMPLLWLVTAGGLGVAVAATTETGLGADRALQSMPTRVAIGGALVVAALFTVAASATGVDDLWRVAVGGAVLLGGVALVIAPWIGRLTSTAETERLERIRAEERADIAAHLHDSVLQSLALIQNRAAEPQVVAALAHQQERELRRWLYGSDAASGASLKPALETLAAEIEDRYLVAVETIVVGDHPDGPEVRAVVAAAREALVNAAKFSESQLVTVFGEADEHGVSVFVRDRGTGFDLDAVPADRRGLTDSIVGRMARAGGRAEVRSTPGTGTEIALRVDAAPEST